jgi:fatty acid synthase, animal type
VLIGKVLFPGTGWLFLVWETFSMMHGVPQMNMKVVFEDVKFMRATSLQKNQDILVSIVIHRVSGKFEIIEGKSAIAQGTIKQGEGVQMSEVSSPEKKDAIFLEQADFYKEMRLRGYYHKGLFRAVTEIREDGLKGKIKWNNDWTTFTDCLIQFQVLMKDTRMLILPTNVRKLVIDPKLHLKLLSQMKEDEKVFPVESCPFMKIIKAGGIEIHGFEGSLVNRRRPQSDPVLEVHKFIPHLPSPILSNVDMAKVCVQIALEKEPGKKILSVEVDFGDGKEPLSEFISLGLGDLPVITPEIIYLSSKNLEDECYLVQNKELSSFSNVNLIIRSNCINDREFLETAKAVLNGKGFVLSRENQIPSQLSSDLKLLAVIQTEHESICMLEFIKEQYKSPEKVIRITSNVDEWLEELKTEIKTKTVLIYSQNEELSGILGLVNCIRKEPNGDKLRCVFINDVTAPKFDVDHSFYQAQLRLGLAVNVLKNGNWGTYRHLKINETNVEKPRSGHYFVNCLVKGDLSTLSWLYGPQNHNSNQNLIRIQYASLNFRDVMLATGKINSDDVLDRIHQQCIMGFEFAGVTDIGRKVMGMGPTGALATHYDANRTLLWDVPNDWSLEEAASVPLVYYTVYLAFFVTSKIEKGKSILIHAGSGGVGLAAIQVALSYGLDVYTTVSNEEKQKFLTERFPSLKPNQIGNSRDTSFEKMILNGTNGAGVDFVLNSLSEDKLQASLRCLGMNGTFLEIGKYDIMNKTKFDMGLFAKRINFRAVFFDDLPVESEEIKVSFRDDFSGSK